MAAIFRAPSTSILLAASLANLRRRCVVVERAFHRLRSGRRFHSRFSEDGRLGGRGSRYPAQLYRQRAPPLLRSGPLIEDNSVRSAATSLVNLEGEYNFSKNVKIVVDVFNLFNVADSDIDYYYASRLPGEPLEGVNGIHLHPTLPRTTPVNLLVGFCGDGRRGSARSPVGGIAAVAEQDGDTIDAQQPPSVPYTHDALVTDQTAAQPMQAFCGIVHAVRFSAPVDNP